MENAIKILTTDNNDFFHVCVHEFSEQAISEYEIMTQVITTKNSLKFKLFRKFSKWLFIPQLHRSKENFIETYLSVTIGPDFDPIVSAPPGAKRYMYCFDNWPKNNKWLIEFSRIFGIKGIFFSAKQATDNFNTEKKNRTNCIGYWVPEGLKISNYQWAPKENKEIDVLEFGRKYDNYHNKIKEPLALLGYNHLYSKPGELLFPDESDFVKGLSKSKISICFPSSITHPERSGDISTMTLRYLQSMAAKCLIVGKLPYDMSLLFDYNPIIEIDELNPGKQITTILENFDTYQTLIEKNYQNIKENHQWTNRIQDILKKIENAK